MKTRSHLVPILLDNLIWLLLLITVCFFSLMSPRFLTVTNITNILVHSAVLGILVIGQSFTLLTGNFDLSAESAMGLIAVAGAFLMVGAGEPSNGSGLMWGPWLVIPIMLIMGLVIGWINGFLITRLQLNNFIATLSMLIILRGLTFLMTQGKTVSDLPASFLALGQKTVGSVPVSVVVMLVAFAVAYIITRHTRFGRDLYAIGGNREAANASGIDPNRRIRQVYLISAVLAAFAAWMEVGRLGVGATRIGEGMIFEIQAAAVIGGISLFGGRGSMIGALGGVLLLASINAGLNLMRVSGFAIDMIRGLIILAAMLLDAQKMRYKAPMLSQARTVGPKG